MVLRVHGYGALGRAGLQAATCTLIFGLTLGALDPFPLPRLEELQSFLLYKNKLTYLPYALLNLKKLALLVVSGDHLVEIPTALCDSSTLKSVALAETHSGIGDGAGTWGGTCRCRASSPASTPGQTVLVP